MSITSTQGGASVTLSNVTISYARHPAVHHVSGCFSAGSLTALAGQNGAGKSTLLKAIAGVLPTGEGKIIITGTTTERIAYLPQATSYERDFPMNVLQLVCTGAWHRIGGFARITTALQDKASQALSEVGMAGSEQRLLGTLSAGQFQRVLFARLLMQDAQLILLDEPFNALDAATTEHLLGVITRWHGEGRTVICILHDMTQIRRIFPECLLLARECIAWGKTTDVFANQWPDAKFLPEPANMTTPEICEQSV